MNRLLLIALMTATVWAQAPKASPKKAAAPAPAPIPLPAEPGEYAVFSTSLGRIVVKLYEKEAPITVANFVGLARGTKTYRNEKTGLPVRGKPFFNGITFHRVIPGFMIQGGDPTGTGMGGGGVPTIPDEFDPNLKFDQTGRLAMANTGRPHTGSCQFFITDGTPRAPEWQAHDFRAGGGGAGRCYGDRECAARRKTINRIPRWSSRAC